MLDIFSRSPCVEVVLIAKVVAACRSWLAGGGSSWRLFDVVAFFTILNKRVARNGSKGSEMKCVNNE